MSFSDYYKQELQLLRGLGEEFSKENPVLASMLNGSSKDPDVERLLEGVAFLTSHIKRKLDDEFPEIVHSLLQIINPQYLRPVPAATIIAFTPKKSLTGTLKVPQGTYIDSTPVDNNNCRFSTCYDIDLHPLEITDTRLNEAGTGGLNSESVEFALDLSLRGISLNSWNASKLEFHLAGNYFKACNLYFLLNHYLKEIIISTPDGKNKILRPASLKASGFEADKSLYPYPKNLFPAYRILQEYFSFPEKFLFMELDLSSWKERGDSDKFSISFICSIPPFELPEVDKKTVELFAVPAVNIFDQKADPVKLEHRDKDILIQPAGGNTEAYQIYSVNEVSGFNRDIGGKRKFRIFSDFQLNKEKIPVYQLKFRPSIKQEQTDLYLSIAYPPEETLSDQEIISIKLSCSNGDLPSLLQVGDISKPTANTPEMATFRNLIKPSTSHKAPLEGNMLWKLLSDLSVNSNAISDLNKFKELLSNYMTQDGKDKPREIANLKRINGISEISLEAENRLFGRSVHRGQNIKIKTSLDNYINRGDMFLFGSVLNFFLGSYASFNTYTALTLEDTVKWETIRWPARLGAKALL